MKYKVGGVYKYAGSEKRFVVFGVHQTASGTSVWVRQLDMKVPDDFVGTWNLTATESNEIADVAMGLSLIVQSGHMRLCDAKEIIINRFGLKVKGRSLIDFTKFINGIACQQTA